MSAPELACSDAPNAVLPAFAALKVDVLLYLVDELARPMTVERVEGAMRVAAWRAAEALSSKATDDELSAWKAFSEAFAAGAPWDSVKALRAAAEAATVAARRAAGEAREAFRAMMERGA